MSKLLQRTYPFLIAVYPVLALKNFNSAYVDLPSIVRTLVVVLGFTLGLWLAARVILRDWAGAGVMTSLAMVVALTYGHVYNQIEKSLGEPVRHSVLSLLLGGILVALGWFLLKNRSALVSAGRFLANTALILTLMGAGQAALIEAEQRRSGDQVEAAGQAEAPQEASVRRPDIYLIVLDGHGRADVLQEEFGYDASAFVQGLTDLGFTVAKCSQSNYASTRYSVTAMFQMDYIQVVDGRERVPSLKNTPLLQALRANGYRVLTFDNYASGHFDLDEDLRLRRPSFANLNLTGGLNEFENVVLNTSVARLLLDTEIIPGFNENELVRLEFYEHYLQTKYVLEELPRLPSLAGPKFVFAHLLLPHIPHVFTPEGDFRFPEDKSKNGYRDNAVFIDNAILPVLQQILANSPTPPVILLMGDHGPPATKFTSPEARMKNLMAFHLGNDRQVYQSVTPVNAFRLVLNEALGADYPLLEDVSYYAYQFRQLKDSPTVMPNLCQ